MKKHILYCTLYLCVFLLYAVLGKSQNVSPDNSFGDYGVASKHVGYSWYDMVRKVLVQSDGKTIIIGHAGSSKYHTNMMRLNSNGTIDESFVTNGKVL